MTEQTIESIPPKKRGFSGKQVFWIVLGVILLTIVATVLVLRVYIFPSQFKPVTLSQKEEQVLDAKLRRLELIEPAAASSADDIGGNLIEGDDLTPPPYSEDDAKRDIAFTERELNGLLASNTDLAEKLVIDLADDLASAKLLVPLDPDFPILGGKTLRINAGVQLAFANERPIVKLRGVSIMGVPIPNAWLGNLKNVDLVREFGADEGFWKTFAAGVELIEVNEGRLRIKLKV